MTTGPVGPAATPRIGLLETRDLTIRFGGHVAVDGVSCAFAPGTLTAIVGPNGAGKTTWFNLISGQLRASAGSVRLDGADITRDSVAARMHRGIGRAFQLTQLFPNLSVVENVRLAVQSRRREGLDLFSVWLDRHETLARAHALVERVHLADRADSTAASLPHGDQRKLEVAMLIALEPSVFMFDEPTAGMSVDDVPVILDLIRSLKAVGDKTILLVEHKMDVVRELADRIVVLHNGRLVADGDPATVIASPVVQSAYLGVAPSPRPSPASGRGRGPPPEPGTGGGGSGLCPASGPGVGGNGLPPASGAGGKGNGLFPASSTGGRGGGVVSSSTNASGSAVPRLPLAGAGRGEGGRRGTPLLRLEGVHTHIGSYHILHGVDFDVPAGAVTVLLGRNGAGKTTTLRTVMGLWPASRGRVLFDGASIGGPRNDTDTDIDTDSDSDADTDTDTDADVAADIDAGVAKTRLHATPRRAATPRPARKPLGTPEIARLGIAYVPENMGVFGDLSVAENMLLAARDARRVGALDTARLEWLFGLFPALKTFWLQPAGKLSGGQKQMLAVARALIEPRRLLLIDEPSKGLAPAIVQNLVAALREVTRSATTVLLVEQNFAVARALGDSVAVMDGGRVVHRGTMAALAEDDALQHRLLGLSLAPHA